MDKVPMTAGGYERLREELRNLKAVERLAPKIESEIAPMTTDLRATVTAARKAAEEASKSFERLSTLAGSLDKLAGRDGSC